MKDLFPDLNGDSIYMETSTKCFADMARLAASEEPGSHDDGVRRLATYVRMFDGTNENPLEHLVRCGIIMTSAVIKIQIGVNNLQRPPREPVTIDDLNINGTEFDRNDRREVIQVVIDAVNHKFEMVEEYMQMTVNNSADGKQYLIRFLSILTAIFICVDGNNFFSHMRS